jgi:hypothetical protein
MITPEQVADYVEGKFFQRLHEWKIVTANEVLEHRKEAASDCYLNGECLHCGCKTPDVFYASRGCSKEENPCYEAIEPTLIYKLTLKVTTWIGIGNLNTLVRLLKIRK